MFTRIRKSDMVMFESNKRRLYQELREESGLSDIYNNKYNDVINTILKLYTDYIIPEDIMDNFRKSSIKEAISLMNYVNINCNEFNFTSDYIMLYPNSVLVKYDYNPEKNIPVRLVSTFNLSSYFRKEEDKYKIPIIYDNQVKLYEMIKSKNLENSKIVEEFKDNYVSLENAEYNLRNYLSSYFSTDKNNFAETSRFLGYCATVDDLKKINLDWYNRIKEYESEESEEYDNIKTDEERFSCNNSNVPIKKKLEYARNFII